MIPFFLGFLCCYVLCGIATYRRLPSRPVEVSQSLRDVLRGRR